MTSGNQSHSKGLRGGRVLRAAFATLALLGTLSMGACSSRPSAEEQSREGSACFERGDFAQALVHFDAAVNKEPSRSLHWSNRGCARMKSGDLLGAVSDFEEAIARDPQDAEYENNRGVALHGLRRYSEALSAYDRAVFLDGGDPRHLTNRAWARYRLGDVAGAREDLSAALTRDPKNARAWDHLEAIDGYRSDRHSSIPGGGD